MYIINKLLYYIGLTALLVGCTGTQQNISRPRFDTTAIKTPSQLQYGTDITNMYGAPTYNHRIAVLIPTSGPNATIGKTLRPALESAALRFAPSDMTINFYDTGNANIIQTIADVLATKPDIIIGPVFSDTTRVLRDMKPEHIPALAFTSDTSSVGNGVFSMALMPSNVIESTLQEMQSNGIDKYIILAPNTQSGHIMAGTSRTLGDLYSIRNIGMFFYDEHDTESIKNAALGASMYTARHAANTRAKEILSAMLNHEKLTTSERSVALRQLEGTKRTDTLGKLPYDAIFFLGNADDTKSLASFLRYYGVGARDVKMYGTPIWHDSDIASDITMTGASFATMPEIPNEFIETYSVATNTTPSQMTTIGYDTMVLAIRALMSPTTATDVITNPSGYMGINGLFRISRDGTNERATRIMRINGDGTTTVARTPIETFLTPIYRATTTSGTYGYETALETPGINPVNYITIPERLRNKYTSKTYGANYSTKSGTPITSAPITVLPTMTDEFSLHTTDYESAIPEQINRTYIDSVEISE